MRERVELLRGSLSTGPVTAPGGARLWEVDAVLPDPGEEGGQPQDPRQLQQAGTVPDQGRRDV